MLTSARSLHDAMVDLNDSSGQLEEDSEMGMTADLVEDIALAYKESLRVAGGLVKTLERSPSTTSEAGKISTGTTQGATIMRVKIFLIV